MTSAAPGGGSSISTATGANDKDSGLAARGDETGMICQQRLIHSDSSQTVNWIEMMIAPKFTVTILKSQWRRIA